MALRHACWVVVCLTCVTREVRAAPRSHDIRLNFGTGFYGQGEGSAGVEVSLLSTVRWGLVQGGFLLDRGGELLGGESLALSAITGGLVWRPGPYRFDLLGVAGTVDRTYDPCTFLCDGRALSIAQSSSPWYGYRLGVHHNFGAEYRRTHFELGMASLYGWSTESGEGTATYTDRSWFDDEYYEGSETHVFPATWYFGFMATVGVTFELGTVRAERRAPRPPGALSTRARGPGRLDFALTQDDAP